MTFTRVIVCAWGVVGLLSLGSLATNFLNKKSVGNISLDWRTSTPLPEPRSGYAAGVIDGKYVIAGGTYWEGTKGHWTKKLYSASTHAFDPATEKWKKLPDAPVRFGYAASVTVRNKLYVMGGYTGSEANRKVFALEKKSSGYSWNVVGTLPGNRLFAGAVSVENFIYLVGGTTEFEPYDAAGTCCTTNTATNDLLVLDTDHPDRGWRQLAPFPGDKRWLFTTGTDGHSIWIFGGSFQAKQQDPFKTYYEVLRYKLAEAKWEIAAPLPDSMREMLPLSPFFARGKIVLVSSSKKVWQLDLKTLEYGELSPLPEAVYVDRFVWLGDVAVGAGGEGLVEGPQRRSESTFIGHLRFK